MTATMIPFGMKRFTIRVNWPSNGFRHFIVAKNADQAWTKFCQQQFGALKPDRLDWLITETTVAS
jgi:hypothetical protein